MAFVLLSLVALAGWHLFLLKELHQEQKPIHSNRYGQVEIDKAGLDSYSSQKKATTSQAEGKNAVVSSENELCSQIGIDVLKDGGSAIDSVVATTICIGVTNSQSSGIGGGGFLVYHSTKDGDQISINFRETAPNASHTDMFQHDPMLAQRGSLSIGVPGELKGLWTAWERYGVLPWKRLFAPSVLLARNGWKVNWRLASSIKGSGADLLADPIFAAVFAPGGKLLVEGDIIKRETYANTLEEIGNKGIDVFYTGWIARQLVDTINGRNGEKAGILTMEDLASYNCLVESPILSTYRGESILTAPPPASGAVLVSILNTLELYPNFDIDDPLSSHRMIEAFKHGYSQRGYYGDPHMDPVYRNISQIARYFTKKSTAQLVHASISDNSTFPIEFYKPVFSVPEDHGTMHISILTATGDAVSLTSTVNLAFGSKIMDPVTGIILNDQMDDFSIPDTPNAFGLAPSPYNFIHPGKRPLSSSVPTIVLREGWPIAVAGASGGSQIITATAQTLIRMLDMQQDPHSSIHEARAHHQLIPDWLVSEQPQNKKIVEGWKARGHNVTINPKYIFTGVAAARRWESGMLQGSGDERKQGAARAY